MAVEDVHVVQAHPLQGRIEAGQQILARAPVAVRPGPHVVAGLGRDHQLVTVGPQVRCHHGAEVGLGRAVRRSVVVGQVDMGDTEVEGPAQDRPLPIQRSVVAEVVPQPERDGGQQQPATSGASVGHALVALLGSLIASSEHCAICGPDIGTVGPSSARRSALRWRPWPRRPTSPRGIVVPSRRRTSEEPLTMSVRRVALLTAGGLAPCLSSAVGGLIERYTELAPDVDIIGYLDGYAGLLRGRSVRGHPGGPGQGPPAAPLRRQPDRQQPGQADQRGRLRQARSGQRGPEPAARRRRAAHPGRHRRAAHHRR